MRCRNWIVVVMLLVMALGFGGCDEKQIDVSDVKDADAYKSLETEYNELNRKYDKLKSKYNKLEDSTDVDEALNYDVISSIGKSTFVKLKCQSNIADKGANEGDSSESNVNNAGSTEMYVDNSILLKGIKDSLRNAILDTKTKVSVLNGRGDGYYTYVLFKDDNSILTFKVYSNDRVVFDDLPKKVFYADGISRVGRAYYGTGDDREIPELTVAQRLYTSDICFVDGELADDDKVQMLSKKISSSIKRELDEKPTDIDYESLVSIEVRSNGSQYAIEMYDHYIRVGYGDKEQWYLCK